MGHIWAPCCPLVATFGKPSLDLNSGLRAALIRVEGGSPPSTPPLMFGTDVALRLELDIRTLMAALHVS